VTKPPEFIFAKNLAVQSRLILVAVLAIIGILLQFFFSLLFGWLFLLVAVLLCLPVSRSNAPEITGRGEWQNVTMDEVIKAQEVLSQSAQVNNESGMFSIASAQGCFTLGLIIIGTGIIGAILFATMDKSALNPLNLQPVVLGGSLAVVFIVDSLTLFLPIWITGRISAWEPPYIRIKLQQLLSIYSLARNNPRVEFRPNLLVTKTANGSVPLDCKLMVKLKDSSPDFMGIQVQTTLNNVQGTKYPYTYCVLIAKPEFNLIKKAEAVIEHPPAGGFISGIRGLFSDSNAKKEAVFPRFMDALVELKEEKDVEIAVVRQNTSGTGYHTTPDQASKVYSAAYQLAELILSKS
jgi:hypothetical protein